MEAGEGFRRDAVFEVGSGGQMVASERASRYSENSTCEGAEAREHVTCWKRKWVLCSLRRAWETW